jgi:PAS domain S-box-containing protein
LQDRLVAIQKSAMSIDQAMLDRPEALQEFLVSRSIFVDRYNSGIAVVSRDGTALADLPVVEGRRGTNYSSNEATMVALAEGKSVIGRPVLGKVLRQDEIGDLVGGFNRLLSTLGKREAQLKSERDLVSAVLQQFSDGVLFFDQEDLRVREANPGICGMLGYGRDELLELKNTELLNIPQDNLAHALQGNLSFVCELNFRKKVGFLLAVEVNASMVETGGDKLTMVNVRDLTERNLARELNRVAAKTFT